MNLSRLNRVFENVNLLSLSQAHTYHNQALLPVTFIVEGSDLEVKGNEEAVGRQEKNSISVKMTSKEKLR